MVWLTSVLTGIGLVLASMQPAAAQENRRWEEVVNAARGQKVYFNAWAGDPQTNAFIARVGDLASKRYGVNVEHAKLNDTAEAVTRVVAEKAAGRHSGGSVDLIWINGPNFLTMRNRGLLFGPFAERLPNWRYVDTERKPSNLGGLHGTRGGLCRALADGAGRLSLRRGAHAALDPSQVGPGAA
jgi:putative thiamine transport system substrate-binding protein